MLPLVINATIGHAMQSKYVIYYIVRLLLLIIMGMYLGLNLGYFLGGVLDIKRRAYAMQSMQNVVTVGYPDSDEKNQPTVLLDLAYPQVGRYS